MRIEEKARPWILDACKKIQDETVWIDPHCRMFAVNAPVGSGKTSVASLAIKNEILKAYEMRRSSVHFFVAPRIRLCAQQHNDILDDLLNDDDLKNINIRSERVDCTSNTFNKYLNDYEIEENTHVIFVICDESLWGSDTNNIKNRFGWWINWFDHHRKAFEYYFGAIIYDEAHNYMKKYNYICNDQTKYKSLNNSRAKTTLEDIFNISLLMSGTPDEFQRKFENRIDFSMKAAIKADYILKPIFNVINAYTDEQLINGIISVYYKDYALRTSSGERVKILVNCQGIDKINNILKSDFIKDGLDQKKFHVITIHSDKKVKDSNNYELIIKSTVDGKENSSTMIFENFINKIDNNTAFEDELPIFLFQVDMLSEGLNLKSFSSAIISTDDARKFVQQMGRVIRLYDGKTSAHIYVMADTEDFAKNLLKNLAQAEYLTEDCFTWGKYIKPAGSGNKSTEICTLEKIKWADLEPVTITEYNNIFDNAINTKIEYLKSACEVEYSPIRTRVGLNTLKSHKNWNAQLGNLYREITNIAYSINENTNVDIWENFLNLLIKFNKRYI